MGDSALVDNTYAPRHSGQDATLIGIENFECLAGYTDGGLVYMLVYMCGKWGRAI